MLTVLAGDLESIKHGFQGLLIDGIQIAATPEQRGGRIDGGLGRLLAMHEARDLPCKGLLRFASARIRLAFLDQTLDLALRQEGEGLQQAFHLRIRAVDPELIELVGAEHRGVKPYRIAFGLAELLALRIGDNRAGEHVHVHAAHLMDQIQPGGEVAPLVGTAKLQRAVVLIEQVQEVVALQHLVAEFGEGDALFGIETACDRVFGEHGAQTEVLADIAQKIDDAHLRGPVVVGDETDRIASFGIENAADLLLQTFGPSCHDVLGVQRAFAGLARIADQTGRAAHQCNGMVACELQVAHVDELYQIADMQ